MNLCLLRFVGTFGDTLFGKKRTGKLAEDVDVSTQGSATYWRGEYFGFFYIINDGYYDSIQGLIQYLKGWIILLFLIQLLFYLKKINTRCILLPLKNEKSKFL